MLGISWVAAQLAASQEGLSSMSEWVNDSPLKRTKSIKSGVFLTSVGQLLVRPRIVLLSFRSFYGFVAVNREPQYWCFKLKSPPTRNLFFSVLTNSLGAPDGWDGQISIPVFYAYIRRLNVVRFIFVKFAMFYVFPNDYGWTCIRLIGSVP
jgi:hypothetical protein